MQKWEIAMNEWQVTGDRGQGTGWRGRNYSSWRATPPRRKWTEVALNLLTLISISKLLLPFLVHKHY